MLKCVSFQKTIRDDIMSVKREKYNTVILPLETLIRKMTTELGSHTKDINYAEMANMHIYNEQNIKKKNISYSTKFIKNMVNELNNSSCLSFKPNWFFLPQKKEKIKEKKQKRTYNELNKLPDINIDMNKYVDIGCFGFWIASSYKNNFGIDNLTDNNPCTFWQTTSFGPHTLTVEFSKLIKISKIFLLFNYLLDESYTPYEIAIHIGNDENHLEPLCKAYCNINNHSSTDYFWFAVDLTKTNPVSSFEKLEIKTLKNRFYVYARCLRITVLSNQHNGRDTRIRQVKLFGPG